MIRSWSLKPRQICVPAGVKKIIFYAVFFFHIFELGCITEHLMTGLAGNSDSCCPSTSMFPEANYCLCLLHVFLQFQPTSCLKTHKNGLGWERTELFIAHDLAVLKFRIWKYGSSRKCWRVLKQFWKLIKFVNINLYCREKRLNKAEPATLILFWTKHALCSQHGQNLATLEFPTAPCVSRKRRPGVENGTGSK